MQTQLVAIFAKQFAKAPASVAFCVKRCGTFSPGSTLQDTFEPGPRKSQAFSPGATKQDTC